jgi:hypothetical protein
VKGALAGCRRVIAIEVVVISRGSGEQVGLLFVWIEQRGPCLSVIAEFGITPL